MSHGTRILKVSEFHVFTDKAKSCFLNRSKQSELSILFDSHYRGVNQVRRSKCFHLSNSIIGGIWSTNSKPSKAQMQEIMKLIVDQLLKLKNKFTPYMLRID
ncbi:unnamed protein product [Didymodactylos carnosus]|uniref:Uncharacterized protein n=1 Tax=Didymodactylos carnosus TaxID=1234261 RepID=A0A813V9Y9_9BILA|nr:unnamed protein product [Didymodactylos carnosus]CAF0842223.1 unnamed protein product [Didymodactylos carnosus]CAF3562814.1 unnamed protein product [Didymodactylos carnosus]CAF3629547.1 unnamed protein product [Didymodactylos carnosus]